MPDRTAPEKRLGIGLITPSATQQGTSQISGHDPDASTIIDAGLQACMSDQRCNRPVIG
jgi:hypothetical protein